MKRDDPNLRWIGWAVGIVLAGLATLGFIFVVIPGIGWQLERAEPDFFKIGVMAGLPIGLYLVSAACIVRPATVLAPFFADDEDSNQ